MRAIAALLLAALLGGCGDVDQPARKPGISRQQRLERAEDQLSRQPVPRVYRYADGELRVLQVPEADEYGLVAKHPCFLWRDFELKTVTMQCPSDSSSPALAGQEDDRSRY